MAVRKVYGSLDSADTLKVMACLFELHLDFEFVPIRVDAGENTNQPFLSLSPFGQLPVFEDGDFKQFESRSIIRNIAHGYAKKGEELIYWDSRKQAVVANWIDVEDHHFEPSAIELLTLLLNNQNNIGNYDQLVADAEAKLSKVLDIYESQLSKFNYLASEKYTIADVLHLPNLQRLMETPARKLVESRPRVNAWCSEILARPAWTKVLQMQLQAQAQAQAQSLAGPKLD